MVNLAFKKLNALQRISEKKADSYRQVIFIRDKGQTDAPPLV